MKNRATALKDWLDKVQNATLPEYENIPDVNLYMDQVVSYVNDCLKSFTHKDQKVITNYMVNNYVKDKLISKPVDRKYTRNQVAYLIAITCLKKAASIEDLSILLDKNNSAFKDKELYEFFKSSEREAFTNVHKKTKMRVDVIERKFKEEFKKAQDDPQKTEKLNKSLNIQFAYVAFKLIVEAEVNLFFANELIEAIKSGYKN